MINSAKTTILIMGLMSLTTCTTLVKDSLVQTNALAQDSASVLAQPAANRQILKSAAKGVHLATACIKGMSEVANPPPFCWKKGADGGSVPNCKAGWHKEAAMCYQNCKDGYKGVAGVCWMKCPKGYTDMGVSCTNWNTWRTKTKKSYVADQATMFESDVTECPTNKYQQAALCYWNCEAIGMHNCGIGACAYDSSTCSDSIGNIVLGVIQGAADAVGFVLSGGATAAAKMAAKATIKETFKKVGKELLEKGLKRTFKTFTSSAYSRTFRRAAAKAALEKSRDLFVDGIEGAVLDKMVEGYCEGIYNKMFSKEP